MFAYEIVSNPRNIYFLSRPHMFGKSLFLSTLKEILEGHKESFNGLYIYDKWDWTLNCTVLVFDFSLLAKGGSANALNNDFINQFNLISENKFGTKLLPDIMRNTTEKLPLCTYFEKLVHLAENANPKLKLALLIDEYDSPITSNLENVTEAKEIQTVLRSFFVCLKSVQDKFFLVYITGETKFIKADLFSSLSHINDMSYNERFNNVCGFTREEIRKNMMGHLIHASLRKNKRTGQNEATDENVNRLLEKLAPFYNGYHFSTNGQVLFSPSSIMNHFDEFKHHNFND